MSLPTLDGTARRLAPLKSKQNLICPKCRVTFLINHGAFGTHKKWCGRTEENFWGRVDKSGDCWIHNGCRDKWGYAQQGIRSKRHQAHRLAYEYTKGPIPAGMHVLHRCDNPPCVNPDHLFLGTDKDNRADCLAKDRDSKSTLTRAQAREVKNLLGTMQQKDIAAKFGVRSGVISDIKMGRTYRSA